MKPDKIFFSLFLLCLLVACLEPAESETAKETLEVGKANPELDKKLEKKKFTGEKKNYYEDKTLKTVVRYKDGKREGKSTNYYKSGGKCVEVDYKNGKIEGLYTWYFENGKPYLTKEYKNDKETGWQKGYHHGGHIKYEAKFNDAWPCTGFKTYTQVGKPEKDIQLIVKDLGYNPNRGLYTLQLELSEPVKDVLYYVNGDGKELKCFNTEDIDEPVRNVNGNIGLVEIPLDRDHYIMRTVTFAAKFRHKYEVDGFVERRYNLSAEPR